MDSETKIEREATTELQIDIKLETDIKPEPDIKLETDIKPEPDIKPKPEPDIEGSAQEMPAQGSECFQDYCNSSHADLARSQGGPCMNPVLCTGGISLNDDELLSLLIAKIQGQNVGIPECHGAAIEKSPWNASELFDLSLPEGEHIREWLFFDKPRRAFKRGNKRKRSLPDYRGRWYQSRKQLMKLGGHKRSFYMDPQPDYMDPQPLGFFEWHLFEYEVTSSDFCLYKLRAQAHQLCRKRKGMNDSVVDLQKQMEGSPRKFPGY
ncbi:hypothetical protein EUGRSUZ_G01448 [Eucalyptus grandis]|uniref:Uncharacterized protein n=1 Tax=Eucalyptus grandis TaxID=71139 RepID=A0ACC3K3P6_EUCGR|nr:hypothetical protein EUGRSUZ_G01448 [Eucalyptus grandis]